MFIEPIVSESDVLLVPTLPVVALVAADQQDRPSFGVEGEQHADLRAPRRARTQLLHVRVATRLDRVHQWTPKGRTHIAKHPDRRHESLRIRLG